MAKFSFLVARIRCMVTQNSGHSVMQPEFYLTKARDPSDYADGNIHLNLQPYLRFGKPKLPDIFEKSNSKRLFLRGRYSIDNTKL